MCLETRLSCALYKQLQQPSCEHFFHVQLKLFGLLHDLHMCMHPEAIGGDGSLFAASWQPAWLPLFVPVGLAAKAASTLAAVPNGAGPIKQPQEQPVDRKGKGKYVEPAKPQDADEDDEEVDFDAEVGECQRSHRKSSTKLCWRQPASQPWPEAPMGSPCGGPHTPYLPSDSRQNRPQCRGWLHCIIRTSCWRSPGFQAGLRVAAGVSLTCLIPSQEGVRLEPRTQTDCDAVCIPAAGARWGSGCP